MAAACARPGQAAAWARSVTSERLAAAGPVQPTGVSEDEPAVAVQARAPEDEPVSAVQAWVLEDEPVTAVRARALGAQPAAAMQARALADEPVLVVWGRPLAGRLGVEASVRVACRAARPSCPSLLLLASGPVQPRSRPRAVRQKPVPRARGTRYWPTA